MLGNRATSKFYRVGGTRGGQNQFKWDDVKSDKDREQYLGNSVNAPTGRWQKGKDLFWYTKSNDEQRTALEEEKLRMREQDDDLLNEAIGIKPKKRKFVDNNLDSTDIKQLLQRGALERDDGYVEPIKGLGAGTVRVHEHIERLSSIEKEILKIKQQKNIESSHDTSSSSPSSSSSHIIIPSAKKETEGVLSSSDNNKRIEASNKSDSSSNSDSDTKEKKKHKSKHHKKEKSKHKHKQKDKNKEKH